MKQTGQLITADFNDNTLTFRIDGKMTLQAGKYQISRIDEKSQVENLNITDVSQLSELLPTKEELLYQVDAMFNKGTKSQEERKEAWIECYEWLMTEIHCNYRLKQGDCD